MIIEQIAELIPLYSGIRITSVIVSILVLITVAYRTPLWLTNPPQHIKLLGLAALLTALTVLGNALDQFIRQVAPGPAVFGSLITLLIIGSAVMLTPENDDRPAPLLRALERLGVRVRSR